MNILIFAGCNDKKLLSKISPLLNSKLVERVYLVREYPMDYSHPKLFQYPALKVFRKILILRELNRVINGLYIMIFHKIDLLIGIHFLMHGIYTYLLARLFRKEYIYLIIEDPILYDKVSFFRPMSKGATMIGIRGERTKNYLLNLGIDAKKIFNPPNEYYLPKDIKIKNFLDKKYDLAYWGNFVEIKDLPLWVDVFKLVRSQIPSLKGLLLGDGVLFDDIKRLIKENGLESSIDLPGRVKEVNPYINDTRILLMTSKSEGLPMDAIESMALGVPGVVPNVGDVNDLIISGENGYVVDSRNPEDYSNIIVSLLRNQSLYNKISKNASDTMVEWSKASSLDSIVDMWDKVLVRISQK